MRLLNHFLLCVLCFLGTYGAASLAAVDTEIVPITEAEALRDTDASWYYDIISVASWNTLLAVFLALVGMVIFIIAAPRLSLFRQIMVLDDIDGRATGGDTYIGAHGIALSELLPSGQIDLGDGIARSATSSFCHAIDVGQPVTVTAYEFGELVVILRANTVDSTVENTHQEQSC